MALKHINKSIKLDDEMYDYAIKKAQEEGITFSQYISKILEKHLKKL